MTKRNVVFNVRMFGIDTNILKDTDDDYRKWIMDKMLHCGLHKGLESRACCRSLDILDDVTVNSHPLLITANPSFTFDGYVVMTDTRR